MTKDAVYLFAQYPKDFAMSAGLAEIIHEARPELPLHLICAAEPNSVNYQWEALLSRFDSVQWVKTAMQGGLRGRFNIRGLLWALTKGFPAARRTYREMQRIPMAPNSIAFIFDGYSLNQSIFLRRLRKDPNASSVLITELTDDALLSDWVLGYEESLYLNLFQRFFGTAYYDVFWMRTSRFARTSQREYRFRNNPADHLFFGEHAYRRTTLRPGQVYWPYYQKDPSRQPEQTSVVIYGGMYYWESLIEIDAFYQRYNELLDMIRQKHQGERLIYLAHPAAPGERENEIEALNLDGFEIVKGTSSEALVVNDPSITTAYAVFSTALFTTACLGVRTHFLYDLFDDDVIPQELKRRLDGRWSPEVHPEMILRSADQWMSGQTDFTLQPSSDRVRAATLELLRVTNVLQADPEADPTPSAVAPEDRWLRPILPFSFVRVLRVLIGVPPTYSLRRRLVRLFTSPFRILRRALLPSRRR